MFFQPDEFLGACTPCVSAATSQADTHTWPSPHVLRAGGRYASCSLGGCELSFRGLLVKTRWDMRSLSCREAVKETSAPFLLWEWRGVPNFSAFSFCSCPHWGGFSVCPDPGWYILPF